MSRVKLNISGLSTGQTSGSYTLILGEDQGKRKLPIVIGSFEAQAIAIEIEKIVPFRPMTHDLLVNFCKAYEILVHEVIIYNLHEGVFHAKLICELNGEIREIDARTSDAIALAVRFKCPIYTYEEILASAGVIFKDDVMEEAGINEDESDTEIEAEEKSDPNDLKRMTLELLHKKLDDAIKVEDYANAARLRDEIQRRKGG